MSIVEIILIAFGAVVFILSFLLPAGSKNDGRASAEINEKEVKEMVEKKIEGARGRIEDIIDETVTYAVEKAERSMERLTNEKIMAINEYSDTVLDAINKNHKEAVFLYDMLNDKQETLKSTVGEAVKTAKEVRQTVRDAEITAMETQKKAREIQEAVDGTVKDTVAGNVSNVEEKEFVPISAPKVEIIYPVSRPEEPAAEEPEVAEKPKKRTRKSRTPKEIKKEVRTTDVSVETAAESLPETSVSLSAQEKQEADEEEKAVKRNNNDRILQLHKAGKSDVAIARELGLGVGEVKLVIGLFEGI